MPEHRVHLVQEDTGFVSPDVYNILKTGGDEKKTTLWQPAGGINDIDSVPAPSGMKPKARSFLNRAQGSDLAVAPEWSYDVAWVREHDDELFADDSPLFVLGCRPVATDDMETVVTNLEGDGFEVVHEDAPDESGKEYVTPTIVPLRADALERADRPTVVIQYKTEPMSRTANPAEASNLATGNRINELRSRTGDNLIVWTCSDLLDRELRRDVDEHVRRGNIVVHPQCNPFPFYPEWTRFRSRIFDNKNDVTYICANWGTVTDQSGKWSYSGVYGNAVNWSSLESYNRTYENGGVQGVDKQNRVEFAWTLVDDGVSELSFYREGNNSATAQEPHPRPSVLDTWVWDDGSGAYDGDPSRTDECDCEWNDCRCPERRNRLPGSSKDAELVAAVAFRRVDTDVVDSLDRSSDVPLAVLGSLRTGGHERLGHAFAAHDHRRSGTVAESTERLLDLFEVASDQFGSQIEPTECDPTDLPINATTGDGDSLDISLSLLRDPIPGKEREWINNIVSWYQLHGARPFKPLILTDSIGETELKIPKGLEDVTKGSIDPEEVTAKSPPSELTEVDR